MLPPALAPPRRAPGVDTGFELRLVGKGGPGMNGGPPGNLHVMIQVRTTDALCCAVPRCCCGAK